ncbi:MAG TPA: XdhC/CoxI family protein [bacterium]|nr:XdhC/CoxI family protein [bacterium]
MLKFQERLASYVREGRTIAVATIIQSRGSTPRKIGAKMIVQESGAIDFTLGGGAFEALVIEDAKEAMREGTAALKCYRFMPVGENATGMTCGGEVEVFLEVFRRAPRLVIFGGGHIALPLARLGQGIGMRVAVIDDRAEFASAARFPEVDEIHFAEGGYARNDLPLEPDDFVVIVTRCHQTDEACLRTVLKEDREPAFIGVVASRRKAKVLLARLAQEGFVRERLEEIRTPIGVDIGAETPEEIAVSILAEVLAVRNKRAAGFLSEDTRVPENVTVTRIARPPRRANS